VLTRLRDALLRDRAEKLGEAATLTIEPHSVHPADSATDEFDHELSLALLAAEQNGLSEVNDAIQRIHRGCYGICEESGRPIPAERLRAVPWARYTAEVERWIEQRGELPRPHLEAAVSLRGPAPGPPEDRAALAPEGEEPLEPVVPEVLEFDTGGEAEKTTSGAVGKPGPSPRQPHPPCERLAAPRHRARRKSRGHH
jgi:RNA polymerase-binding transcription factor DksA